MNPKIRKNHIWKQKHEVEVEAEIQLKSFALISVMP